MMRCRTWLLDVATDENLDSGLRVSAASLLGSAFPFFFSEEDWLKEMLPILNTSGSFSDANTLN